MGKKKRHSDRTSTPPNSDDPVDYSNRGTEPAIEVYQTGDELVFERTDGDAVVVDYDAARRRPSAPPDFNLAGHYDAPTRVDGEAFQAYTGPENFAPTSDDAEGVTTAPNDLEDPDWDSLPSVSALIAADGGDANPTVRMDDPISSGPPAAEAGSGSEMRDLTAPLSEAEIETDPMEHPSVPTQVITVPASHRGPGLPARRRVTADTPTPTHSPRPKPAASSSLHDENLLNEFEAQAIQRSPWAYIAVGVVVTSLTALTITLFVLAFAAEQVSDLVSSPDGGASETENPKER